MSSTTATIHARVPAHTHTHTWLQVTMGNALTVTIVDAGHQLLEEFTSNVLRESLCLNDTIKQLTTSDQLQYDINVFAALEHLSHADDVILLQNLHDGNLSLELSFHILLSNHFSVDNLDGVGLVGGGIDGVLDLAERTTTQRLSQLVFFNSLWHVLCMYVYVCERNGCCCL